MKILLLVLAVSAGDDGCWVDVSACASIDATAERLACFDRVAEHNCAVVPTQVAAPPTPPQPAAAARSEFGLVEPLQKKDEPKSIEATVANVRRAADGLVVTLDIEDQLWRQVDNNRLSLKLGERVRIRAGVGGSFYLNKVSGSRSIRVRRIR